VEWSADRQAAKAATGAKSEATAGKTRAKRAKGAAATKAAGRREATTKRCPRCDAAPLDVVTPATGAAYYACPAGGCGFTLPVGARRRGVPCPRCGGVVLERRETGVDAPAWSCARAGCDYRVAAS
jgi:ssDNA-binding Zn-finger/Zn-ribbon topoisomerase 1